MYARNDLKKRLSFRTFLSSDVILIRNLVKNLCGKIPAFAGMTWKKSVQKDSGFQGQRWRAGMTWAKSVQKDSGFQGQRWCAGMT